MEQIVSTLWAAMPSLVATFLGGVGVWFVRFVLKFKTEHTHNNQVAAEHGALKEDVGNLKVGVKTILKSQMVKEHKRLVQQHFATPEEKDHFEDMFTTYKTLGGNGTGQALYEDVMQMYSIAPKKEER